MQKTLVPGFKRMQLPQKQTEKYGCANAVPAHAGFLRFMRYRFTLIELLVVIAIIAVLASMLLPALGKAKSTSETSQCSRNLKNFAYAINQYAQDHNGMFPIAPKGTGWIPSLQNAGYYKVAFTRSPQLANTNQGDGTFKGMYCPSGQTKAKNGKSLYTVYGYVYRWADTNSNINTLKTIVLSDGSYWNNFNAATNKPSQAVIMTDSIKYDTPRRCWHQCQHVYTTSWPKNEDYPAVGAYHNKSGNGVFMDTHVERIRPLDCPKLRLLMMRSYEGALMYIKPN